RGGTRTRPPPPGARWSRTTRTWSWSGPAWAGCWGRNEHDAGRSGGVRGTPGGFPDGSGPPAAGRVRAAAAAAGAAGRHRADPDLLPGRGRPGPDTTPAQSTGPAGGPGW